MVMTRERKKEEVARLKEQLEKASSLVLTDFKGLDANQMVKLREEITKEGMDYKVIKNTLAKIAARESGVEIEDWLEGPIGICFGYDDPVLPFKIGEKLTKDFDEFKLKGGIFERERVEADEVYKYASIPSREELLAQLVFVTRSPIQKLATSLKAIIQKLAIGLNEVRKNKEKGGK